MTPGQKNALPPSVGNCTPTCGSAKANTNSITASGELRNTVTHAVPIRPQRRQRRHPERGQQRAEHERANAREQADPQGAEEALDEAGELVDQCIHVGDLRAEGPGGPPPDGPPGAAGQLQASAGGSCGTSGRTEPTVAFHAAA